MSKDLIEETLNLFIENYSKDKDTLVCNRLSCSYCLFHIVKKGCFFFLEYNSRRSIPSSGKGKIRENRENNEIILSSIAKKFPFYTLENLL